jgi:hypothetical protein
MHSRVIDFIAPKMGAERVEHEVGINRQERPFGSTLCNSTPIFADLFPSSGSASSVNSVAKTLVGLFPELGAQIGAHEAIAGAEVNAIVRDGRGGGITVFPNQL